MSTPQLFAAAIHRLSSLLRRVLYERVLRLFVRLSNYREGNATIFDEATWARAISSRGSARKLHLPPPLPRPFLSPSLMRAHRVQYSGVAVHAEGSPLAYLAFCCSMLRLRCLPVTFHFLLCLHSLPPSPPLPPPVPSPTVFPRDDLLLPREWPPAPALPLTLARFFDAAKLIDACALFTSSAPVLPSVVARLVRALPHLSAELRAVCPSPELRYHMPEWCTPLRPDLHLFAHSCPHLPQFSPSFQSSRR